MTPRHDDRIVSLRFQAGLVTIACRWQNFRIEPFVGPDPGLGAIKAAFAAHREEFGKPRLRPLELSTAASTSGPCPTTSMSSSRPYWSSRMQTELPRSIGHPVLPSRSGACVAQVQRRRRRLGDHLPWKRLSTGSIWRMACERNPLMASIVQTSTSLRIITRRIASAARQAHGNA